MAQKRLMTISEAADRLGVHQNTLRKWADEGKIPVTRLASGYRRFDPDDIEAEIARAQTQKDRRPDESEQRRDRPTVRSGGLFEYIEGRQAMTDHEIKVAFMEAFPGYMLGDIVQLYQPGWVPGAWYTYVTDKPNGTPPRLIEGFGKDRLAAVRQVVDQVEAEMPA